MKSGIWVYTWLIVHESLHAQGNIILAAQVGCFIFCYYTFSNKYNIFYLLLHFSSLIVYK